MWFAQRHGGQFLYYFSEGSKEKKIVENRKVSIITEIL